MSTLVDRRNRAWAQAKRIGGSHPSSRTRAVIAVALGLFWTAFMLVRLFVPSTVGLADETDGHRYMCQRGLELVGPPDFASTGFWVTPKYHMHTWYGELCGTYRGDETKYASSHEAVIWLGQQLTHLFGMPGALDLRALGIFYAVLIGLAVGLTFALMPGNLAIGVLTTIGIGLVYAESVIAVYFISPYAEPTAWAAFALLLPALLWYWRAPRVTWPRLALVVGLSFVIVTAKPQGLGYLPAMALALLWTRRSPIAKVLHPRSRWKAAVANWRSITACVLLVSASAGYISASGNRKVYSELNAYEMVFMTLLPAGHDPAGDLRAMGADPALAYATGTTMVDPHGAAVDPRLLKFNRDVTEVTVLKFIATHPGRLIALTEDGTRALGRWRPGYLGNYLKSSGEPALKRECRSCFYYYLLAPVRAKPFLFGVLLLLAVLSGLWLRNVGYIRSSHRVMGKLVVFTVAAAVGEFWFILLTQGIGDEVKHHVFTMLPVLLSLPIAVSCIFLGRRTESVEFDDEDLELTEAPPAPTPAPASTPAPAGT
jgi:hypothetical protein